MKKILYLAPLLAFLFAIPFAHADALPAGCMSGDAYSPTTGQPCAIPLRDCQPGDLFSGMTGLPCSTTIYLPGCYSADGFSTTTGEKCDGSSVNHQISEPTQVNNNQTSNMTDTNQVTQSTDATVQPAYVVPIDPNVAIENAGVTAVRETYPSAVFGVVQSMSNGQPGTVMEKSSTDPTIVAEFWNTDGIISVHMTNN